LGVTSGGFSLCWAIISGVNISRGITSLILPCASNSLTIRGAIKVRFDFWLTDWLITCVWLIANRDHNRILLQNDNSIVVDDALHQARYAYTPRQFYVLCPSVRLSVTTTSPVDTAIQHIVRLSLLHSFLVHQLCGDIPTGSLSRAVLHAYVFSGPSTRIMYGFQPASR